jgi:hypothetical protein
MVEAQGRAELSLVPPAVATVFRLAKHGVSALLAERRLAADAGLTMAARRQNMVDELNATAGFTSEPGSTSEEWRDARTSEAADQVDDIASGEDQDDDCDH